MSSTAASGFVFLLLFVQVIQSQDGWGVTYASTDICGVKGSLVYMSSNFSYPSTIKDDDIRKRFWFVQRIGEAVDLMSDPQYSKRVEYRCFEKRCDVIIRDLRESDSHVYKSRFTSDQKFDKYFGAPGVTLTVTDPSLQVEVSKLDSTRVDLKCLSGTDQHDDSSYIWYENGKNIKTGPSYSVSFGSSNSYYCAVKGPKNICSPSVHAPMFPSVSVSPSEIVEGLSVTLTCRSDANPAASYTWYKEDQPLFQGPEGVYRFSSISTTDSGTYYCKSENPHGSIDSSPLVINVQYAPEFLFASVNPSDEIMEGNSVTLTCSSDANPAASHTWYKGKKKLLQVLEGVYRFTSISSKDSGTYYCKSKNKHGEVMSTALSLNVQYPPRRPSMSVSPSNVVKGSSVTLTCSSDANPAANYTWYKVDEDLPKASGRILIITNFTADHSGIYSCEAKNTIGHSNSTFHLSLAAVLETTTMTLQNIMWILVVVVLMSLLLSFLLMRMKKA